MTDYLLATFFMVLGLLLLTLEFVFPSLGILSVMALVAYGTGLWFVYTAGGGGWAMVAVAASVPVFFFFFWLFFKGPLARLISLKSRSEGQSSSISNLQALIGQEGEAVSSLRPSGIAIIQGTRRDVVTDGDFVNKGERIVVVRIGTNSIVVDRVAAE
jgi:membrane-bound ClpP family serine protease